MAARLITSLLFLTAVSTVIGLFFTVFGIKFWIGFTFGTLLQIILHNVFMSILNTFSALKNKQLENERIKEFTYQGLEVTCPCNKKHIDFVPLRFNTPNSYKCGECLKSVAVYLTAETAMQTEPIVETDVTTAIAPIINNIENGNS
jgi:hypothetical protein